MIADLETVMRLMNENDVRCILIGGWAAIIHGSRRSTNDVDLVYARDDENIRRIVAVLKDRKPYLRGAPAGLPFFWDERTIRSGLNFTLTTDIGDVDFLGEVAGGGTYDNLLPHTQLVEALGIKARVVTLEKLIELKQAAGRKKDKDAIAELVAIKRALDS
ncbi:MAG: hypothetical protein K2X38_08160 [Gemmataceae bacterium]|nr:hypothetical protein [Gemmataceae bacterium]